MSLEAVVSSLVVLGAFVMMTSETKIIRAWSNDPLFNKGINVNYAQPSYKKINPALAMTYIFKFFVYYHILVNNAI